MEQVRDKLPKGPYGHRMVPTQEAGRLQSFLQWRLVLNIILNISVTSPAFRTGQGEFTAGRENYAW